MFKKIFRKIKSKPQKKHSPTDEDGNNGPECSPLPEDIKCAVNNQQGCLIPVVWDENIGEIPTDIQIILDDVTEDALIAIKKEDTLKCVWQTILNRIPDAFEFNTLVPDLEFNYNNAKYSMSVPTASELNNVPVETQSYLYVKTNPPFSENPGASADNTYKSYDITFYKAGQGPNPEGNPEQGPNPEGNPEQGPEEPETPPEDCNTKNGTSKTSCQVLNLINSLTSS